jgi:hypothetical protein
MHGNEPVGRELLMHLAERLAVGYGTDTEITQLLGRRHKKIIDVVLPDFPLEFWKTNRNCS